MKQPSISAGLRK